MAPTSAGMVNMAAGMDSGSAMTSTQLMTSQPGIFDVSLPENA